MVFFSRCISYIYWVQYLGKMVKNKKKSELSQLYSDARKYSAAGAPEMVAALFSLLEKKSAEYKKKVSNYLSRKDELLGDAHTIAAKRSEQIAFKACQNIAKTSPSGQKSFCRIWKSSVKRIGNSLPE